MIGCVPVAVEVAIAKTLLALISTVVVGAVKLSVPALIVTDEVDATPSEIVPALMATVEVAPVPMTTVPLVMVICAKVALEDAMLPISICCAWIAEARYGVNPA